MEAAWRFRGDARLPHDWRGQELSWAACGGAEGGLASAWARCSVPGGPVASMLPSLDAGCPFITPTISGRGSPVRHGFQGRLRGFPAIGEAPPTRGTCPTPPGSGRGTAQTGSAEHDGRPTRGRTAPANAGVDRATCWRAEPGLGHLGRTNGAPGARPRARRPPRGPPPAPACARPQNRLPGPATGPRHRPPPGPPPAGRLRQRRVTFAGPQLPSTSTARTYTATFDAGLRTGSTIPAVGVCSVAIFHGPLLTEYLTR